jgi:putative ABC transport system permease protein
LIYNLTGYREAIDTYVVYSSDLAMSRHIDTLIHDLKFALRSYRRSPGFTLTALLAISVGIAATTAVFSVTDPILFRKLPYRAENQLVSFGMVVQHVDGGEFLFAADYKDLLEAGTPFQSVTSWSGVDDCDITDPNALRQRCAAIDWNFLSVFGIHPILGADFSPTDTRPGALRKVILSYEVWKGHFASDKQIAGKMIMVDGAPARIAGVLPASFELPTLEHADLLTPQIIVPRGWLHGATRVLRVIGRLKEGVALSAAHAELAPFFSRALSYVPAPFRKEVQFRVRSVRDRQMGSAQLAAWTLFGAVLAVMLISCANVANLLLARAAGRQTEFAIRTAIGISRGRLMRQMLTESLLLAVSGGIIGCALGGVLLRIAVWTAPNGIPHLESASMDGRVLAASLVLSVLTGILFGLAPAFERPRTELLGSSRCVTSRSSTTVKNILVAAQIALSTVLLAAAGLLVRSLWNLETQPLGMQIERVLTAQLILPSSRYTKPEERVAFFNQVERQLSTIPALTAFGLSDSLPPAGWERSRPLSSIEVIGRPRHEGGTGGLIDWRYVSPGYFEALRIPVLQGRAFREEDRGRGVNLCLLSRALARRLFPMQNPVGQHLKIGTNVPIEIVGIVPDVKNTGLFVSDNPEYYILRTHVPDDTYVNVTGPVAQRTLSIVLRSPISEAALSSLIKQRIAALDPTLPVAIQTMRGRLSELAAGPRFNALLLITFASMGLFLAAVGLYGTIAYLVAQRTQEIGIRMSLGATPAKIASLLLGYSVKWTVTGAAIGILAALATTHLLSSLLFHVSARDPFTLVITLACLFLVATLAAANPARKAASVDPVTALRNSN